VAPPKQQTSSSSGKRPTPTVDFLHPKDENSMPVSVTPVKFCKSHLKKNSHQKANTDNISESFFSFSRPLSAQNDRAKSSPRHFALMEKNK
jgi:hypothetical protein